MTDNPAPAPRLDLMPSAADRWMTCAASPRFCLENADLIPADTGSRFSREGNTAHEVAAALLQDREPDPEQCPTPIDAEMRLHAWNYMEYVDSLRDPGSKLIVEHKQALWYYEGRNAIVDAAVINDDSLHIVDLKYGAGVAVSPERNLQTVIYARQIANGLTLPLDFPIFSHIYQPRCRDSGDEPAKVWQTTWGEVKAISDEIADHAEVILINNRVKGGQLPFVPSEKACRWCPAKAFCPAREHEMLDGLEPLVIAEPAVVPPLPIALTSDQLASVLRHKKNVEKWLDDCEKYAHARLTEGHAVPGFKLVQGRDGNRYWSDQQKAKELLLKSTILKKDEIVEESIISVAAVEKLLGKNKLPAAVTNLIARPAGKPTIAPADDPRPECVIHAENEFEVLSDEEKDRLDDF
jgi:hypothetical protein